MLDVVRGKAENEPVDVKHVRYDQLFVSIGPLLLSLVNLGEIHRDRKRPVRTALTSPLSARHMFNPIVVTNKYQKMKYNSLHLSNERFNVP